ncbi:hypothetical protein BASA81_002965 [Batrachochytrium salamandrivorans]|nr:hypothetical protein BASA81_002965 [Batrachochytrium salamandrivorans]
MKLAGCWGDPVPTPVVLSRKPILDKFAEIGGLNQLVARLQSAHKEGGDDDWSEEDESVRMWLAQLGSDLKTPGLPSVVAANQECMRMLLGIAQTQPVGSSLDLALAHVSALRALFSTCSLDVLQFALTHGVVDRLLLKLGEVQVEEPRRPEHSLQFQLVSKRSQADVLSKSDYIKPLLEVEEEGQQPPRARALWRPGYGTGPGNEATKQDQQRELHQAGKNALSVAITDCLTLFIIQYRLLAGAGGLCWPLLFDTLDASCLLRVFLSYFFETTSQAVVENLGLYTSLLELVSALAFSDSNNVMLTELVIVEENLHKSLGQLVESLTKLAFDDEEERDIADLIASTFALTSQVGHRSVPTTLVGGTDDGEEEEEGHDALRDARYAELMQPELFKDIDMRNVQTGMYVDHHFHRQIEEDAKLAGSKLRQRRLNRELKALKTTLPLHFGSTVALRIDRTRPFVGKFIVFAPANTPYDSGAFLFDWFCANEYPSEPPKVNLTTTGGSQVRFNPNLYPDGKVCLSVLGTWRGGANGSENWDPERSTLLQVLVSIQSAILGSEFPYFNEPTVELQWGTTEGEIQKRIHENGGYERLRVATILHAMTAHIKTPPPGFEDCIRIHFTEKREYILNHVCPAWLAEAQTSTTPGHLQALQLAVAELKTALSAL